MPLKPHYVTNRVELKPNTTWLLSYLILHAVMELPLLSAFLVFVSLSFRYLNITCSSLWSFWVIFIPPLCAASLSVSFFFLLVSKRFNNSTPPSNQWWQHRPHHLFILQKPATALQLLEFHAALHVPFPLIHFLRPLLYLLTKMTRIPLFITYKKLSFFKNSL